MDNKFNADYLVSSPDYSDVLNHTVIPGLQKCEENQTLSGKDGMKLFCSVFRAVEPRGTVLVLHGFTENAYKYAELIWSLVKNGFNVVAYDQRGHGRSGRTEGLCHPSVTHVDRFEDYTDDLEIVCNSVLCKHPKPWTIFAHSMGGAVAALFLEQHPEVFSAACLCSPMIAPNTGVPVTAATAICKVSCVSGRGDHHPFFYKLYSGPEDFETSCATDRARFDWYDAVKASREEFWNSVPTYGWTLEAIHVTRKILAPGAPESIACPILLSSAETDFSVLPEPQKEFISRVPRGKQIFVKNSRHEIFRSENDVLFPWWHQNLDFLKEAEA